MTQNRIFLKLVVILVAAHSFLVGGLMLFFPWQFLGIFGLPCPESIFFPSQSGVFLLILALGYLLALLDLPKSRRFLAYVVLVKAVAFIFLMVHWLLLNAPLLIGLMGLGDGTMGFAVYLLMRFSYGEGLWRTAFGR